MKELYEKYHKLAIKLLLTAGIFLFIYFLVKYFLPFFAPFVIAVIISMINEPFIRLLEKKAKIPRKIAAIISLLFTISILGVIITIGIIKIFNELIILQENLSTYIDSISGKLNEYFDKIASYYNNLPPNISNAVDEGLKNLSTNVEGVIKYLVTYLLDTLTSIPRMAVFIIMTLLGTYFISSDRNRILHFINRQIPESWSKNISGVKTGTLKALFGYLKAYLILMSLTFIEVTIGLFFIGADYILLMGLIVALSDAIPILGTGIVMVPWIAWNLISGNMQMAFGLSIIYIFGVIVRQILEPKIVGDQIGLHPLATLISMYIGLSLFGVLGLFVGPISVILVKNLQDSGLLRLWKD